MNNQLGPLEVICDAPPYPIVQACNAIGIEMPEDVRWAKMRQYVDRSEEPADRDGDRSVWQKLLHPAQVREHICNCREKLPKLAKYRFTYSSGDEVTYSVGQCRKCRTVYWEEG
ncbi:hypothetical protein AYO40_02470 [Planctomycetaceae bacterium SCGC AG-212-D15]|nr:hypothetical protein AYO40_02470 [Planctomycetaceae bacterium SCGC AG-212-D15]